MWKKEGTFLFTSTTIPGEWLTDPQQEGNLRGLIRQCQVILIAIDTPYLFAKTTGKGYGRYHEEYNKPLEIANFFKKQSFPGRDPGADGALRAHQMRAVL